LETLAVDVSEDVTMYICRKHTLRHYRAAID